MRSRQHIPEEEAGRRVGHGEGAPHGILEGIRSFSDGNFGAANRRFQSLLPSLGRTRELLIACGHASLHDNDPARALSFYREAQRSGDAPPEVHYNLALLAMNAGETDRATSLFRQVLDSKVRFSAGKFYLGLFFESPEEFLCDTALYLARLHRDSGHLQQARDAYQEALSHVATNVTALHGLGELALLGRSYIEAKRYFEQILAASSLEEDLILAHNNLGIACYENGAIEEAIENLKWVLRHSPANPTAINNLNHIYEREGVFRSPLPPGSMRFVDVEEGARPIFSLAGEGKVAEQMRVVVGRSSEMLRVMRHARVAAACESPVLIHGENGTGKQLLAETIALNSTRRKAPLIIVNCGSIPDMQLESELFGHEKGAFTGARARKPGALEQAAGGSLFLDDITALSPLLQGKLYRALSEGHFLPVGSQERVPLDVRLICGTNRDLAALMREGHFREDLYYLVNVITIELPALRDRRDDIPLLVEHFLRKHARSGRAPQKFPAEDLQVLQDYEWPGNVRELENLVERAMVLGSQSSLFLEELARLRRSRAQESRKTPRGEAADPGSYPVNMTLAELEKRHILSVLESVENNHRAAAKVLGINPSTLWRKLKSYDEGT